MGSKACLVLYPEAGAGSWLPHYQRTLLCRGGNRSSERLNPSLKVTKLLCQVCLDPPNITDLRGEVIRLQIFSPEYQFTGLNFLLNKRSRETLETQARPLELLDPPWWGDTHTVGEGCGEEQTLSLEAGREPEAQPQAGPLNPRASPS